MDFKRPKPIGERGKRSSDECSVSLNLGFLRISWPGRFRKLLGDRVAIACDGKHAAVKADSDGYAVQYAPSGRGHVTVKLSRLTEVSMRDFSYYAPDEVLTVEGKTLIIELPNGSE